MKRTKSAADPLGQAMAAATRAVGSTGLISVFINLTMLAWPIYSIQVNDRVLASKNVDTLIVLSVIVVFFLGLYGTLDYVRSAIQVRAALRFDAILRRPLFKAALRRELSGRASSGQQALRDADALRDGIASGLIPALCDIPWVPVFVLLSFTLHPVLGLVALVGALVVVSSTLISERATRGSVKQAGRLSGEANAFAGSVFKNAEVVRALGMTGTVIDRWSRTHGAFVAHQTLGGDRAGAILAASKAARQLVQIMLLGVGAWLVIRQEITPGIMMASSIIMGRALAPVEQVVAQWRRIVSLRDASRRITDLMKAHGAEPAPLELPRPQGRIDLEDVYVVPPAGSLPVVKALSLSIGAGESVAVVGQSGSGKSSLARTLAGVWRPRSGVVRIDGTDYAHWQADRLGGHIGYLPQTVELFEGTVAENIARLGPVDDAAVIAAARAAGAHDQIIRLPKGYDTVIGEGGAALSGGMRQRVGLARAVYGNPSLIVLDEPDANLDEEGEAALATAIRTMTTMGRTVVIVTHRPSLLSQVDRILVLSGGQKLAFGPRDQVIAQMRAPRRPVALAG